MFQNHTILLEKYILIIEKLLKYKENIIKIYNFFKTLLTCTKNHLKLCISTEE
ncbi:hypothetical protein X975_21115, partial [Stegodyphus mimosarum]